MSRSLKGCKVLSTGRCAMMLHPAVREAPFSRLAAPGRGEGFVVGRLVPQPAAVGVKDQRAIAVHHIQEGIVAVQGARDIAKIAIVVGEDGVRIQNQPTAGAGLVGLADDGLLGPDGGLGGVARQLLAEQFRIGGGHGNHLALWRHHHAGIEVPQLFLLAPRFFRHQRWPGFHVGQHVSAVGQIPPYVVQKGIGGRGQLRGIDAVNLQRVVQQQVALHQITGGQAAGQHQNDRQQADPQDQAPKVDAEHGRLRQDRAGPGGTPEGGMAPVSASQAHMA
ncbi:hypothetical protein G6F57_016859 [Rhizopus arrhizus]|nr:hypothetical protein G6F57_016859 [Rhizopus arrhizus]